MRLELGPIVRSNARHKSTFLVIVLQLASTFTVMGCLLLIGSLFHQTGRLPLGYDPAELISVKKRVAATVPIDPQADLRALTALPEVFAASPLWPGLRDESEAATLFYPVPANGAASGGTTSLKVRGLVSFTTPAVVPVLGLHFIEGDAGSAASETGIILTRKLRDALFPAPALALGRMVASHASTPARIVGVVDDVLLREPFWASASLVGFHLGPSPESMQASYLVRARPGALTGAMAAIVRLLGPSSPTCVISIVALGQTPPRLQSAADGLVNLFVLVGLSVVAITLIGAVAVSSFVVSERRRQIGIRRALGATRWDVFRYFLVESSLAAALGTGLGLALTAGLLFVSRRMFPTLTLDWRALAGTAFLLWVNATTAALWPARRALRISPSIAARGL